MASFVLRGFPYPVVKSPHGYFYSQTGVSQIKSDLLTLLQTNPKERVMHPEFGIDLRSLFFELADTTLANKARAMIIAGLQKWEPRVAFDAVDVSIDPDTNLMTIKISFIDPENIQDIEVLTLQLPMAGGSR